MFTNLKNKLKNGLVQVFPSQMLKLTSFFLQLPSPPGHNLPIICNLLIPTAVLISVIIIVLYRQGDDI